VRYKFGKELDEYLKKLKEVRDVLYNDVAYFTVTKK